jgi:hypothetical protein
MEVKGKKTKSRERLKNGVSEEEAIQEKIIGNGKG